MLWLVGGCVWMPSVHTECAPLRLATGRPECDGISLCIETTRPSVLGLPERVSTRSWFQTADGTSIQLASSPRCTNCEPNLQELVCADVEPEQTTRR
jgi:hypothetical protein